MITLAGQPLLLPDSDGELLRWQEAFQAARQYDLFAEPATVRSSHNSTNYETVGVGLPAANYPDPPGPRINTLYWPTGATRWARGYFLANAESTAAIIKKSASYSTALTLSISNTTATALTIKVYLLPPRPISVAIPGATENQLFLIPVVDERYFWNHSYSNVDLDTDPETSWSGLLNFLTNNLITQGTSAGNVPTISPPAAYLIPDKIELQRRYENAALMLDAICLSTGYRLVTKFDGRHVAENAAASQAIIDDRNDTTFQIIAGGSAKSAFAAAATLTTFNKFKHGRALESGDKYTKSVALSDAEIKSKAGTVRVVQSSLLADYSTGSIGNSDKCDDLAAQIEDDYASWARNQYDTTIAGVSENLIPCGYDDSILMTFGAQRMNEKAGGYEYEAHTRVKSYPLNFGIEQQLSQDPYITVLSHFQKAVPAEDVATGTSGDYYFIDPDGEFYKYPNDTKIRYEVHNEFGPDAVALVDEDDQDEIDEKSVYVHWKEEEEKWKTLPRDGKTYILRRCYEKGNPDSLNITIRVSNPLAPHIGKTVKISDGYCYTVEEEPTPDTDETDVQKANRCRTSICATILAIYDDCDRCKGCWKLTRYTSCGGSVAATQYTRTDLAAYEGKWIKKDNDGYCWYVEFAGTDCPSPVEVEFEQVYETCETCGVCYNMPACADPSGDIIQVSFDPFTYYPALSLAEIVAQEKVFRINGVCRTITGEAVSCASAIKVNPTETYDDCDECGCWVLTPCGGGTAKYVYRADGPDGQMDLDDYIGQPIRLDDGVCYTVAARITNPGEDPCELVTVLEAYDSCTDCVCWTLHLCDSGDPGTTKTTYNDLSAYGVGGIVKEDGTTDCWEIVDDDAVFAGTVEFIVDGDIGYSSCETCQGTQKYKLTNDCENEECVGSDPAPEIITTEDFADSVGLWRKVGGICYSVAEYSGGDPVTTETAADSQGPFGSCEECQEAPITATKRVMIDLVLGDDGVLTKSFEKWTFTDGVLTGVCRDDDETIETTEDCP